MSIPSITALIKTLRLWRAQYLLGRSRRAELRGDAARAVARRARAEELFLNCRGNPE